jgi:hypothetical protein
MGVCILTALEEISMNEFENTLFRRSDVRVASVNSDSVWPYFSKRVERVVRAVGDDGKLLKVSELDQLWVQSVVEEDESRRGGN